MQATVRATTLSIVLALGILAILPGCGASAAGSGDLPRAGAGDLPRAAEADRLPDSPLWRLSDRLLRLEEDGLDPAAYGVPPESLAREDPAAWQAALRRSAAAALPDLLHGRVRDLPGRPDIRRDTAAIPLGPWLADLASAPEPAQVIDRAALLPPEAAALRAALAQARAVAAAGGWPTVPGSGAETIEPGAEDPWRVPALRARLLATDPVLAAAGIPPGHPLYDPALVEAVRRFQSAQGLEPDGRVGRLTLAALNRPADAVVRQLRVALDMRRAAPAPGPERRIEVNIPHQRLQVLEGQDRVLLDMAVVVGQPARQTPPMRTRLTAVQFNPPWGVPERNAREDLLPRFRRDPRAMMEKGFRVFGVVDGQRVEIDPTGIDWRSVNPQRFPYFIRQDAGAANALGQIKFIMPNNDLIFMHDTPDRHLFRRAERALSSGCIRLEQPMELLGMALRGTEGWDRNRADRVLASRRTGGVTLARSLPVLLHYTTVVVGEGGEIRMRRDIYGLDAAYARAMEAGGPRMTAAATPDRR